MEMYQSCSLSNMEHHGTSLIMELSFLESSMDFFAAYPPRNSRRRPPWRPLELKKTYE